MARITISAAASGTTLAEQINRFGNGATAAVGAALEGVKEGALTDLRQEIAGAFPRSRRMPTTITGKAYQARADGAPPTAWIHPRKGSNVAGVLAAHRGTTILPTQAGTALAIPTRHVPNRPGNRGRMSPDEVAKHFGERLTLVRARPGSKAWGYLVLKKQAIGRSGRVRAATPGRARQGRQAQPIIMFVLVPQVTLPARLRPEVIMEKWVGLLPSYIDQAAGAMGLRA
jgi:hypothetical protein